MTCLHLASRPWNLSGIVEAEVGSLLKVIDYGATSRHLSDNQPTTGTQCRITFILSCRQADICFCFIVSIAVNVIFIVNCCAFHWRNSSPLPLNIRPRHIMPSSSKSPQAPSTKTHSFLRKSTDESPSFKTTSTSVPSEVRTSQSTNSLSPRSNESGPSPSAAKTSKPSKDWKSRGSYLSTILPIKLHVATSPNLLPVVLTFVSQEEAKGSINVDALLDTGCLAGDFVARRIVDRFNIKPVINSAAKISVCSGLDNTCCDISKSVIICVNYLNEC